MMEQERAKHKLFTYCILQRCSFPPLKCKAYSTNQEKTITINMQEFQPLCANRFPCGWARVTSWHLQASELTDRPFWTAGNWSLWQPAFLYMRVIREGESQRDEEGQGGNEGGIFVRETLPWLYQALLESHPPQFSSLLSPSLLSYFVFTACPQR